MNKYLTLIFLCITAVAFSCKNSDEAIAKKLTGTWQGMDYTHDLKNVSSVYEQGGKEVNKNTRYVFNADGTFTETCFTYQSKGKWIYNDATKKLTLEYTEKQGPQEIMKPVYDVTSLTGKELKLRNSLNGQGFEYLTFEKK